MMNNMSFKTLCAKIERAFDWTPVAVSYPMPEYREYRDAGRVLLGYCVRVRYKYHGVQAYLFSHDTEKLGLISQERALNNAMKFYERMRGEIKGR